MVLFLVRVSVPFSLFRLLGFGLLLRAFLFIESYVLGVLSFILEVWFIVLVLLRLELGSPESHRQLQLIRAELSFKSYPSF